MCQLSRCEARKRDVYQCMDSIYITSLFYFSVIPLNQLSLSLLSHDIASLFFPISSVPCPSLQRFHGPASRPTLHGRQPPQSLAGHPLSRRRPHNPQTTSPGALLSSFLSLFRPFLPWPVAGPFIARHQSAGAPPPHRRHLLVSTHFRLPIQPPTRGPALWPLLCSPCFFSTMTNSTPLPSTTDAYRQPPLVAVLLA